MFNFVNVIGIYVIYGINLGILWNKSELPLIRYYCVKFGTPIFPHSYIQFSATMVVNNIFFYFEFEIKFDFFCVTVAPWNKLHYFIDTQFNGK